MCLKPASTKEDADIGPIVTLREEGEEKPPWESVAALSPATKAMAFSSLVKLGVLLSSSLSQAVKRKTAISDRIENLIFIIFALKDTKPSIDFGFVSNILFKS